MKTRLTRRQVESRRQRRMARLKRERVLRKERWRAVMAGFVRFLRPSLPAFLTKAARRRLKLIADDKALAKG